MVMISDGRLSLGLGEMLVMFDVKGGAELLC